MVAKLASEMPIKMPQKYLKKPQKCIKNASKMPTRIPLKNALIMCPCLGFPG